MKIPKEKLAEYLAVQIEEIQKYKWIESEKCGYDIGFQRAAFEWIEKYACSFRKAWTLRQDNS